MISEYLKDLSKETFFYGIGQAVRRFFSLFTAPILTRIFEPTDYGVISLITTTMAFAGLVLTLGFNAGIFRHYYEVDENNQKVLLFSGIASQMTIVLSVIGIFFIFADSISVLIFGEDKYSGIIRLALFQLALFELFEHFMTLLRYKKKAKQFMAISIVQLSANLAFLLFFVVYLDLLIPGVYIANICAYILPLIFLFFLLRNYYKIQFNFHYVKECLQFSVPLMPGWLINMYLMQSNRFYLQSFHGAEQVGLYSIGERISSVSGMFISMFFLAWDPLSMKLIPKKDQHYIYDSIARLFLFIGTVLVAAISVYAKEVLVILTTEKYFPAYTFPGIIGLGTLTFYFNYFLGQGIIISKKTIYQSYARIVGAAVATIAFVLLVPPFEGLGAAIGLLIGYFSSGVILYLFSLKLFKLPFRIQRIISAYFFTFSCVVLYLLLSDDGYLLNPYIISIKFVCLLIFIGIQGILIFTEEERRNFFAKVKDYKLIFRKLFKGYKQ